MKERLGASLADVRIPGYQVANLGYCITSFNSNIDNFDRKSTKSASLFSHLYMFEFFVLFSARNVSYSE
jgi:hypothetical protein